MNAADFPKPLGLYLASLPIVELTLEHAADTKFYSIGEEYVLKVTPRKAELKQEKERVDALQGLLPVPTSIFFYEDEEKGYYLRTKLPGKSLLSYLDKPEEVVNYLAEAINLLHQVKNVNFDNSRSVGTIFVHGDLCLPNIIVNDGKISGFVDRGDCGRGDPWMDISWALWSLEFNLHDKRYGQMLLDKLGLPFIESKYNNYVASRF